MKWWLLFAGGGAGSMLRYAVGLWVEARTGPGFPWGTFAVNVSGCFLIGVLATLADEHKLITPAARLALVTGVLGGFTTFSTYVVDVQRLVNAQAAGTALVYLAGTLAAALLAVWLGGALAHGALRVFRPRHRSTS